MSVYEDAIKTIKTKEINNFIDSLGDTPDQVADNVQGYEVVGKKGQSNDCPITNLIRKQFNATIVSVTGKVIAVILQNGTRLVFETPKVIASFITRFDAGDYPKLEEKLTSADLNSLNDWLIGQQITVYAGANESFDIILKEELV